MSTAADKRWFPDSMPQPMVDHHTLPWWQAATEHRLTVQQCRDCNHCQLPPAPICSACTGDDLGLQEVSGEGEIYTFTIVHRAVAMDQKLPFVIAIVELDMHGVDDANSVRMMTNLVDVDPAAVAIGQSVCVAWETMSDTVSIPRFKPAE